MRRRAYYTSRQRNWHIVDVAWSMKQIYRLLSFDIKGFEGNVQMFRRDIRELSWTKQENDGIRMTKSLLGKTY